MTSADVLAGTERPGGSAETRYKSMVKEWRRSRFLRRIRVVTFGVVVLLTAVAIRLDEPFAFNIGFFSGATACFWFGIREMAVPAYIDKWRQGAEGEKWTAKELRRLPQEWRVRHDLQGRYGNVDHMAVGPAGLFLLDTKCWQNGTTTITPHGPVVAATHDPELTWDWTKIPARMRGAAANASDAGLKLTGRRVHVRPVVVIWGDFPGTVQERRGVTYVAGEHLYAWLTALRPVLSDADAAALAKIY